MKTAQEQPDPTTIYVALDAFATMGERVIALGERVRGDDPLLAEHPELFTEDAPPEEILERRLECWDREMAKRRPKRPPPKQPLRDQDALIVLQDVTYGGQRNPTVIPSRTKVAKDHAARRAGAVGLRATPTPA